jgi:hypothetical protein
MCTGTKAAINTVMTPHPKPHSITTPTATKKQNKTKEKKNPHYRVMELYSRCKASVIFCTCTQNHIGSSVHDMY